jgi:hypothetical protein
VKLLSLPYNLKAESYKGDFESMVSWLKSMYQCEKESVPRRPDELTDINDASRDQSVCTYTRSTRNRASQLLRESTGEVFGTQTPTKSVVIGAFKLALQQKHHDNSEFSD